ncbi:hypothetical protein [Kitasatospora sp. NPDC057198]|uniref:hypothetical protein n=1 Tax=Kitasatospora sp. NPDC057198 TaxID=3346046 RepID=UPI00363637CF
MRRTAFARKSERDAFRAARPEGIRRQIDGYVLQDGLPAAIRAVTAVTAVGLVRFDAGVAGVQLLAGDRYRALADRIVRDPGTPVDPDEPDASDEPDDEAPRRQRPGADSR